MSNLREKIEEILGFPGCKAKTIIDVENLCKSQAHSWVGEMEVFEKNESFYPDARWQRDNFGTKKRNELRKEIHSRIEEESGDTN